MIDFIICEDSDAFQNEIVNVIHKIMFQNDVYYKIKHCKKYDGQSLESGSTKVYIIDFDSFGSKAIRLAKKIRENDFESILIVYTNFLEKYSFDLFKDPLFIAGVLNHQNISSSLARILDTFLKPKSKILQVKSGHMVYKIPTAHILYLTSEKFDRHISIVTKDCTYTMTGTLANLKKSLGDNFVYSHRSCLVNMERVSALDKQERKIYFDNGEEIDLVSFRLVKKIQEEIQSSCHNKSNIL